MERYLCPIIGKKYCKFENADAMICSCCTVPEVYKGIRPKVPESHCEAASRNYGPDLIDPVHQKPKHKSYGQILRELAVRLEPGTGYETPDPSVSTALDKIYYDMIENCPEFKNLSMDRQGEMMNDLAKVLDKYGLV